MKSVLNHVALLVESIESVVDRGIFDLNCMGKIEEFPSEGTRELYIGRSDQMGKLLLMQAHGPGPYQDALKKRGTGLHHFAIDVLNLDEFISTLSGSGWYLHPRSLGFYHRFKQVWLSRPGVPVLIEVNETKELVDQDYFIEEIIFPFKKLSLMEALLCSRLSLGDELKIKLDYKQVLINDILD